MKKTKSPRIGVFLVVALLGDGLSGLAQAERPNVVVVMTDDQGYGDFGFNGNPTILTPHLDAMESRSGQMTQFYVSPVCAPTRACLMTGRYNYRTRCIDTYIGRAMMDPGEETMAEIFSEAGYQTGIFGKWHLGDNYPMRAMDQGFQRTLVHRGGGIGQPSDPLGAEGKYTDPVLFRNGEAAQFYGYCTDIYFSGALDFIDESVAEGNPFLVYLPMNCPHGPFHDVPKALYQYYRKQDLSNAQFAPNSGHALPGDTEASLDKRARIFAMITNVDENMGRLFDRLKLLDVWENTIVVFLVDNGPNGRRFVGGMRGAKTSVYEGGVRSPLLFHWPAGVAADARSSEIAAHYDLLPTLLDACRVSAPAGVGFDGRSFLPALQARAASSDRHVYIQAHRGNEPVRYHNFMVRNQRWKLLHASGFGRESFEGAPEFELYDLSIDPLETRNVIAGHPGVFTAMRQAYDDWFDDVSRSRPDNYAPPAIYIGAREANPVQLTRQDWRHTKGQPWGRNSHGHWIVDVRETGRYEVTVYPKDADLLGRVTVTVGSAEWFRFLEIPAESTRIQIELTERGRTSIRASYEVQGARMGPHQLEVRRLE